MMLNPPDPERNNYLLQTRIFLYLLSSSLSGSLIASAHIS